VIALIQAPASDEYGLCSRQDTCSVAPHFHTETA
jgi:hypothetical protein